MQCLKTFNNLLSVKNQQNYQLNLIDQRSLSLAILRQNK